MRREKGEGKRKKAMKQKFIVIWIIEEDTKEKGEKERKGSEE